MIYRWILYKNHLFLELVNPESLLFFSYDYRCHEVNTKSTSRSRLIQAIHVEIKRFIIVIYFIYFLHSNLKSVIRGVFLSVILKIIIKLII